MSAPLRLVMFDVDGTLVDSQGHILAAMTAAFSRVGRLAPPRPEVLEIIGLSLPEAFARLCPGAEDATRARLVAGYKAASVALREAGDEVLISPLFPGIRGLLDQLAAEPETLLGVATGKSRRGLTHLLAAHELDGRFVTRQAADGHPSKPHPAMLLAALSQTGVAAAAAMMIGDTTYDMEMARAAGLRAIGVGWGYHASDRLLQAGAHRVVGDVAALARLLSEARGGAA